MIQFAKYDMHTGTIRSQQIGTCNIFGVDDIFHYVLSALHLYNTTLL